MLYAGSKIEFTSSCSRREHPVVLRIHSKKVVLGYLTKVHSHTEPLALCHTGPWRECPKGILVKDRRGTFSRSTDIKRLKLGLFARLGVIWADSDVAQLTWPTSIDLAGHRKTLSCTAGIRAGGSRYDEELRA